MSRFPFRRYLLREVRRLHRPCRPGFAFLIHQTKQSRHVFETRNLDIKGSKQIQSNTYARSKICFGSKAKRKFSAERNGDARWVSYERMWNSYRWCVTFYRYQEQINAECANRRGIKNHNQQLFTFFDSCSKTLGRFLAGSCNGLRAHKESSRHFDFLQG